MGCNGSKSASVVEDTSAMKKFSKKFTNKNDWNNEALNGANGQESADEELNSISSLYFDDKKSNEDGASIDADDLSVKECFSKVCESKYFFDEPENTSNGSDDGFEPLTTNQRQPELGTNEKRIRQYAYGKIRNDDGDLYNSKTGKRTEDEDYPEHPDSPENPGDQSEHPERDEHPERSSEHPENPDYPENPENPDFPENTENPDYPEQPEQPDRDPEYPGRPKSFPKDPERKETDTRGQNKRTVPCVFDLEFTGANSLNGQARRVKVCGMLELAQNARR